MRAHVKHQTKKAYKTLKAVASVLDPRTGLDQNTATHVYKTLVRPHAEFGAALMVNATDTAVKKLEGVQRQALLKITGCLSHTSTEALEVLTNVMPLDIYLRSIQAMEYARLVMKNNNTRIGHMMNKWQATEHGRTPTTLTLLHSCYRHNMSKRAADPVEEEFQYKSENISFKPVRTRKVFNISEVLSKKEGAVEIQKMLGKVTHEDVICFTDGSTLGNPGPTGSGAAIYLKGLDSIPICLKKSVSSEGNNYIGELHGLLLAAELIKKSKIHGKNIFILCDCKSAIEAVSHAGPPRSNQETTMMR